MHNHIRFLKAMMTKEILSFIRNRYDMLNSLIFFVLIIVLFPLAMGNHLEHLSTISSAVIWVSLLLSITLSLDKLFKEDYDTGILQQLILQPIPLSFIVVCKILIFWLIHLLPLIFIAPLLLMMLDFPLQGYLPLLLTLIVGSLVMSFIGAMGAALTLGVRQKSILLSLITLPFYIPVLIFSTMAVDNAISHLAYSGYIAILLAILCVTVLFSPPLISLSLKLSIK